MIIDTGILVAAADRTEARHDAAAAVLAAAGNKIVTDAIVSEAHHLMSARVGYDVAAAFLTSLDHDLIVEPSNRGDRERAAEICAAFIDARIDYTDALTVAIAERLGESIVATLDERDFRLIRPRHIPAFDLIP